MKVSRRQVRIVASDRGASQTELCAAQRRARRYSIGYINFKLSALGLASSVLSAECLFVIYVYFVAVTVTLGIQYTVQCIM